MYVRVAIREWLLLILPRGIQFVLATFGLHPETLPNARSSSNSAATLEADASKKISVSSAKRLSKMSTPETFRPLIPLLLLILTVNVWATIRKRIGESK